MIHSSFVIDLRNCIKYFAILDCGVPDTTGYTFSHSDTKYGATANVTCATGYEGTPSSIECLHTAQWETVSGCERKGTMFFTDSNSRNIMLIALYINTDCL